MNEQRAESRVSAALPIYVRVAGEDIVEDWTLTSDLSERGVRLQVHKPLEIGTVVHLELDIPEQLFLVSADGQVAWCRPLQQDGTLFEAGVSFNPATSWDADTLGHAVTNAEQALETS